MLNKIIEIFKVIFLGVIEGISEWLPISSSGHMLLVDEFIKLDASDAFKEMFFIFIQLGAILAVIVIFFKKLFPFYFDKGIKIKNDIMKIWYKVIIACIPGAIITFLFDDFIEQHLHTAFIISMMLILYGIIFILVETFNKRRISKINHINELPYRFALYIGLFQVLSIIPGTSRSGATIVGSLLIGVNREVASEFTFFLAVPVMLGLSLLKLLKFGFYFTGKEITLLLIGMLMAFITSLIVIRFITNYIKKHDFKIFGIYRIVLGLVLIFFFLNR